MNNIGFFEIQSSDPPREVSFYRNVFGWNFILLPHIPIAYYLIETGGIGGGLLKRPVPIPSLGSGTNAFTCSFQVKSFDETSALILENGGRVAMAKFLVPNRCWQGYFLDADNNTFGIFEVLDANSGLPTV
jgi:uncharacterized protein